MEEDGTKVQCTSPSRQPSLKISDDGEIRGSSSSMTFCGGERASERLEHFPMIVSGFAQKYLKAAGEIAGGQKLWDPSDPTFRPGVRP